MFDYLRGYDKILVTGPQRSGTTICAQMIAHDTGHIYVDEARFGIWDFNRANEVAMAHAPCVLQGPGLLRFVDIVKVDAILLMRRPANEIMDSLKRTMTTAEQMMIHWPECMRSTRPLESLPTLMYYHWDLLRQSNFLSQSYVGEIVYESLSSHDLWVPKEERGGWGVRQWKN